MAIARFPPVDSATADGLLMIGGDLEVDSLLLAYKQGVFPWPLYESLLTWFAPPQRAVLFFDRLHISKRLRREQKNSQFCFTINRDFSNVIRSCAVSKNRRNQPGTWITPQMIDAYIELHKAGYAHSVECYLKDRLVGGIYGIAIGNMFAGESMFYLETNASKLSLCFLIDYLKERGCNWLDCQVMTPLLHTFGASEISRADFSRLLSEAINQPAMLFSALGGCDTAS